MVHYTYFKKRSMMLLCLCIFFVEYVFMDTNEGHTGHDKVTAKNDDQDDVITNSLEFPLMEEKEEYEDTNDNTEVRNDGELVNNKITDFNEELDTNITSETHESLINPESVNIDNTFNISDFKHGNSENKSNSDENKTSSENVSTNSIFATIQNVSDTNGNITVLNNTLSANLNATSNSSKPAIRWPCNPLSNTSLHQYMRGNESTIIDSSVVIVNNETTLGNVIAAMNRTKVCGLLLFYSPYCEFCTNLAPLYNAVGRSYNDVLVLASDAQNVMGISAKYGIVGIPTILLFHSGKAVAKYNRSRTVADFKQFILQLTGVLPTIPFNITNEDNVGPLTSTLKESRDYYLIFSICFIIFLLLKLLGPCLKSSFVSCYQWLRAIFTHEKVD